MKNITKTKINYLLVKLIMMIMMTGFLLCVRNLYFVSGEYGEGGLIYIILLMNAVLLLLPIYLDKVYFAFMIIVTLFYYMGQNIYFLLFNQYMYIQTFFSLFDEGVKYVNEALNLMKFYDYMAIFCGLCIIVISIFLRVNRKKIVIAHLISMILGGILFFVAPSIQNMTLAKIQGTMDDLFLYNETDLYLYDTVVSKTGFVQKFGIEQFLLKDIYSHVLEDEEKIQEEFEYVETFLNNNMPYMENEMTGIFEGKSLYLIQAESLVRGAINPVLTPTLYKLMEEGWNFEEYNSPLLTGSTSDVETMVNTSLVPVNDGNIVSQRYAHNTYLTTLPHGFGEHGYEVTAVHNNYGVYYNRENYLPALGYPIFMDPMMLGLPSLSSDLSVQKIMSWISPFQEKAFNFWVTYSGHQPYNVSTISDRDQYTEEAEYEYLEYLEVVKAEYPDITQPIQLYLAKNMSLDRAIEDCINTYSTVGRLDDLVIAVYGDHYVKGLSTEDKEDLKEVSGTGHQYFETPLIIWNSTIEHQTMMIPCTSIDLLPTLFNLFNIEYDKTTVLGNDIFDERYKGFRFNSEWSIQTGEFTYDLADNSYHDLTISQEEAKEMVSRYLEYQDVSNIIFKRDYFNEDE